jgi:hypothetical protein
MVLAACATGPGHDDRANLVGSLWWVTPQEAGQPVAFWQEDLDYLQLLGMDLLVLNGPYVGDENIPSEADPMKAFFEEADRRGLRLFVDTAAAPNWWTLDDPAEELERARKRVGLIHERYGRFEAFAGFYIPYELYVMWDDQAELIRTLYREVAATCKTVAPDKPTMISPFFILDDQGDLGSFRWATPDEYQAFWSEVLAQAAIDIVALQDSGEHLSCYTFEQRRPFFEAMKAACDATGTTLWANIETGELNVESLSDYVARFGMKTHVNDPRTRPFWRGVPAGKVVDKLTFVQEFASTAITWGYREYVRPSAGHMASELYLEYYQALIGGGRSPLARKR